MTDDEELRRFLKLLTQQDEGDRRMGLVVWSKYGGEEHRPEDAFNVSMLAWEVEQALRDADAFRAIVRLGREIFQKDS